MKTLRNIVSTKLQEISLPKHQGHAPNRMAQCNSVDPSNNGSEKIEMSVTADIIKNRKKECYDKTSIQNN